jgi:hypothetical protein
MPGSASNLVSESGPCKPLKQRVGMARARVVLGMELSRQKPGMMLELNDLHQPAVGRKTAQDQSVLGEVIPVGIVEFVPVTMPFTNLKAAVRVMRARPFLQDTWI